METKKKAPIAAVMPIKEALAIKVTTISPKVVGGLPETGIRVSDIEGYWERHTIVGYIVTFNAFLIRENSTGALIRHAQPELLGCYGIFPEMRQQLNEIMKANQLFVA